MAMQQRSDASVSCCHRSVPHSDVQVYRPELQVVDFVRGQQ